MQPLMRKDLTKSRPFRMPPLYAIAIALQSPHRGLALHRHAVTAAIQRVQATLSPRCLNTAFYHAPHYSLIIRLLMQALLDTRAFHDRASHTTKPLLAMYYTVWIHEKRVDLRKAPVSDHTIYSQENKITGRYDAPALVGDSSN
ncbi:hypothetical protein M405DRAFT_816659 [Rhizopogon salebrosus TDB-379]|nr:hypothetical protein M405DRAFT_816659 [Rhizopogon salebrosus TDB-379]